MFLGLLPNLKSWLNRPIISVEVQEKNLDEHKIWQYWLLVTNKGKTTAQAVNITIKKIVQNGKQISSRYYDKGNFRLEKLNDPIQSEEKIYVKLISLGKLAKPDKINIQVHSRVTQNLENRCNTVFSLLVTGDNFQPFTTCVKYIDSETLEDSMLVKC